MRSQRDYHNRTEIAALSGDPIHMDNLKTKNPKITTKNDIENTGQGKNNTNQNDNDNTSHSDIASVDKLVSNNNEIVGDVIIINDLQGTQETITETQRISNKNDIIVLDTDDGSSKQQSDDSSQCKEINKTTEDPILKEPELSQGDISCSSDSKITTENRAFKSSNDVGKSSNVTNTVITNKIVNDDEISTDVVVIEERLSDDTYPNVAKLQTVDNTNSNKCINIIKLDSEDDDDDKHQNDDLNQSNYTNKDVIIIDIIKIDERVQHNTENKKTTGKSFVEETELIQDDISRTSFHNEMDTNKSNTANEAETVHSNENLNINESTADNNPNNDKNITHTDVDENIAFNTNKSDENLTDQDQNNINHESSTVVDNNALSGDNIILDADVAYISDIVEPLNVCTASHSSSTDASTETSTLNTIIDLTTQNPSEIQTSIEEFSAKLTSAEVSKIRKIVFWLKKFLESLPLKSLSKEQTEALEWAKRNSHIKIGDITTSDHKLYTTYIPLVQSVSNPMPMRLSKKHASKIRKTACMIQKYAQSLPAERITDKLKEALEWANRNQNVQKNDITVLDHRLGSSFSQLFQYSGEPSKQFIIAMAAPGSGLTRAEARKIKQNANWLKYNFESKDISTLSATEIECFEWAKRNLDAKRGDVKTKDHILIEKERPTVLKAAFAQIALYFSKQPQNLTMQDRARLISINKYISKNKSGEFTENEKEALKQSLALINDKSVGRKAPPPTLKRSTSSMSNRLSSQSNQTSIFVLQAQKKINPQTIKQSPKSKNLPARQTSTPQTSRSWPRYFDNESPLLTFQQLSRQNAGSFRQQFPARNNILPYNQHTRFQTNLFNNQSAFFQNPTTSNFPMETPSFQSNNSFRQQSFNNNQPFVRSEEIIAATSEGIRIAQTVFDAARYIPTPERRRDLRSDRSLHSQQSFTQPSLKRQRSYDEIYRPKRFRVRDTPAGYIVLAILDVGPGNGTTLPANWKKVQEALLNVYKDILEANPGPPPVCRELGWLKGRAKLVACADRRSVRLYKQAIQSLGEVWPGARLRIVPKCQIASKPRSRAWIPAEPSSPKEILNLIRLSNPELPTQNWKVAKLGEISNQRRLATIILNPQSLKKLLSTKGEVNYGFGSIFIKIYKDDLWMAFKSETQNQSDPFSDNAFSENAEEQKVFADIIDLSYMSDSAESDLEYVDIQINDDW